MDAQAEQLGRGCIRREHGVGDGNKAHPGGEERLPVSLGGGKRRLIRVTRAKVKVRTARCGSGRLYGSLCRAKLLLGVCTVCCRCLRQVACGKSAEIDDELFPKLSLVQLLKAC